MIFQVFFSPNLHQFDIIISAEYIDLIIKYSCSYKKPSNKNHHFLRFSKDGIILWWTFIIEDKQGNSLPVINDFDVISTAHMIFTRKRRIVLRTVGWIM